MDPLGVFLPVEAEGSLGAETLVWRAEPDSKTVEMPDMSRSHPPHQSPHHRR